MLSNNNEQENLSTVETEEQADALLETIERPDHAPIQDAPEQQPTQQQIDEWELTVGGKPLKAKREQVIQWAQMGYDAPNKIRALTKEIDSWKQKESQFKQLQDKYGPIDEYVQKTPQFWDHVLQSYEQRNQVLQDASNPLAGVVQQLQAKLDDLTQFKSQFEERQSQERMQQEDQVYMQTLEDMRKSYPDIDFVTPDDEGKTLEYKVLEHAQKEGIKNFKTAFRDFYHDELVKREAAKAKEAVVKEKQKNTKLGIMGVSPTPTTNRTQKDPRKMSYDDLADEALRELGLR